MRWKPVINAVAITFHDRWPAADTYQPNRRKRRSSDESSAPLLVRVPIDHRTSPFPVSAGVQPPSFGVTSAHRVIA